jgi:putative ABC transport system ATP-binding protein
VPETDLEAGNVSVVYGSGAARVEALRNVSLCFERGRLSLIMGPSGSGKTTLLTLLGCLLTPGEGSVRVHGKDVSGLSEADRARMRQRSIGFVFQAFRLFHSLSAFDNVLIAADVGPGRSRLAMARARELLGTFGLEDRAGLKPRQLSGGEKQRVAIARALLPDPAIILADEPTASVDSRAGRQIAEILRNLAVERRRTVVVVSHDPRWAEFAHRTIVLEDGRVTEDRSSIHD